VPNHPVDPDIDLLDGHFYAADPHAAFRWMRRNAPIYFDEKNQVWGITRHAHVQEVAKNPQVFCNGGSSRPDALPIPSMINMDGVLHKRRRNLVNSGFTPRRVADQEPKVRQVCVDLIERVAPRGCCEFVREVAAHLPMIMIGDMLGVAPEDREMLLRWSDDLILGTSATATPEAAQGAAQAFAEYAAYHRKVVADRRARPQQADLMSVLVHAEIDGERLDDEALLQESLLILIGGDETTRHVLTGGLYQLMLHPEQQQQLAADPARIPRAVEEMLRWVTPVQNMARTATRDVSFHGEQIHRGDKLLLLYPSANRDEDVFEDPFCFDTSRDPNLHLAFGGYGPHFCLGSSLARLELRVMFEELLVRLPDIHLASGEPPPVRPSNFIAGFEALPVAFTAKV